MPDVDQNAPQWHYVLSPQQSEAVMTKDNPNHANGADKGQLARTSAKPNAAQWQHENRTAILAYNAWVNENGLPLEEYRQF